MVDITNYVMFELKPSAHAYDLGKLNERRIVVRKSKAGEKIRTLDGAERTLAKDMAIADGAPNIDIGGVMGGAETEISFADAQNILIECAWFDPIAVLDIEGARPAHGLLYRFGAAPTGNGRAYVAAHRRTDSSKVAGGEILSGVIDVYPRPEPREIRFTRKGAARDGRGYSRPTTSGTAGALGFVSALTAPSGGATGAQRRGMNANGLRGGADDDARHRSRGGSGAPLRLREEFPPRLPPAQNVRTRCLMPKRWGWIIERLVALEDLSRSCCDPDC